MLLWGQGGVGQRGKTEMSLALLNKLIRNLTEDRFTSPVRLQPLDKGKEKNREIRPRKAPGNTINIKI